MFHIYFFTNNFFFKLQIDELIKEIQMTKEEFNINDHYLYRTNIEMVNSEKVNSINHKPSSMIIKDENFHLKNNYIKTNPSEIYEEQRSTLKSFEKNIFFQQNANNSYNRFVNRNTNFNAIVQNTEKPLILNTIQPNSFVRKIHVMPENPQILERSRHVRQMSLHVPSFKRQNVSPFAHNTFNNIKIVKF